MGTFYRVKADDLNTILSDLFEGYGFNKAHSRAIASNLTGAELTGLKSHGAVRVELYLTQQKLGGIRTDIDPEIVYETPVSAVIEANHTAGAVAGEFGVKTAIRKAKESGMAMVTVRNSNHFGACGYYTGMISKEGLIGFAATNSAPLMASPVTKKKIIGNNPFSLSFPAGKYAPINLDISNGVMAFGKIFEYRRLNKPFPENAWLDKDGNPTTDPFANDFIDFISLPIAGHKGYGLAVAVEAITSLLSGGAMASQILPAEGHSQDENNPVSHTFIAVDPKCFGDPDEIRKRAEWLIDYLHGFETRNENDKVFYPGEIEGNAEENSKKNGILLPANVFELIMKKDSEAGITIPENKYTVEEH